MLRLAGISAGYGKLPVLWDVDLDVNAGEWVALIGASGAGKTTLMKTVAGLIAPCAGAIHLAGARIDALPAHARVPLGLALVPEGRRLFAGMTVEENLRAGAHTLLDSAAVAERLSRAYALFPILSERRRQIAGTLSGGQQQMCAIARALMSAPRLLLIDELSLGLSPVLVDKLVVALAAIRTGGTALLVIEQDVDLALTQADRGYIMRQGRIVKQGRAADLQADPDLQNEYFGC